MKHFSMKVKLALGLAVIALFVTASALARSGKQDFVLHKLLDDQQDKASPNYHKWVTPDEFGVQFGPSDQDIRVVTGWLQSHGFQVNRVSHGRTAIEFSGAEAQVEEAERGFWGPRFAEEFPRLAQECQTPRVA